MTAALPMVTAVPLTLAVVVGLVRLGLRRRSASPGQRGPLWRFALLVALHPLAGLLLFLTLHPPLGSGDGVLVVATRGTTPSAAPPDGVFVALPEGGAVEGAERVPDLATALRRHPDVGRIRLLGDGLPPRDRIPLRVPVEVAPTASPRGFTDITPPQVVAPGAAFSVSGGVGGLPAGAVELVDPSGAVVARASVASGGRFTLKSQARTAGLAVFELRLRDAAGRLVERLDVPLETLADPLPRVVVLAGAPGPEINLLRRWARTAGVDLGVGIDLGAGVRIDEGGPALTRAALAETDLLVIDDRRWDGLSPETRAAVVSAVEGGMGLLLRPTGPLAGGTRREWAILGVPVEGGGDSRPLALAGAEEAPEPARRDLNDTGADAVSAVIGPDGAPLASWRARRRGRIAVWTLVDSYVLALAGRQDLHANLWSSLFSDLARPVDGGRPRMIGLTRVGDPAVICGLTAGSQAQAQTIDGRTAALLVDANAGPERCAAYWPSQEGWSQVGVPGGAMTPIYVHSANAAPALRLQPDSDAPTVAAKAADRGRSRPPTVGWLAFLALLTVLAALWFIERRRGATTGSGGPA